MCEKNFLKKTSKTPPRGFPPPPPTIVTVETYEVEPES